MRQNGVSEKTAAALESQRANLMAALRRAVRGLNWTVHRDIDAFLQCRLLTQQEHAEFRAMIEQAWKADNPAGYVRRAFERFRREHGGGR